MSKRTLLSIVNMIFLLKLLVLFFLLHFGTTGSYVLRKHNIGKQASSANLKSSF